MQRLTFDGINSFISLSIEGVDPSELVWYSFSLLALSFPFYLITFFLLFLFCFLSAGFCRLNFTFSSAAIFVCLAFSSLFFSYLPLLMFLHLLFLTKLNELIGCQMLSFDALCFSLMVLASGYKRFTGETL